MSDTTHDGAASQHKLILFYLISIDLKMLATALVSALAVSASAYRNELDYSFEAGEIVKTARPHTYLSASDLPESLDYRKQGLLTTDLNQHIPVYCGSWYSPLQSYSWFLFLIIFYCLQLGSCRFLLSR